MQWQEMDTAPRDGRFVLIYHPTDLHAGEDGRFIARWNDAQDEWDDGARGNPWRYFPDPVLWAPLPHVPTEGEE